MHLQSAISALALLLFCTCLTTQACTNRRRLLPKRPLHLLPLHLRPRAGPAPTAAVSTSLPQPAAQATTTPPTLTPATVRDPHPYIRDTQHSPRTQTTPAATPPGAGKSSRTPTPHLSSTSSSTNSATAAASPPGVHLLRRARRIPYGTARPIPLGAKRKQHFPAQHVRAPESRGWQVPALDDWR